MRELKPVEPSFETKIPLIEKLPTMTSAEKDALILAIHEQNKHLRRANSKLKNIIRSKDKQNAILREGNKPKSGKKQHFKNGKRGTKLNG